MSTNRLHAFKHCGSQLWLEHAPADHELRLRCNCCHDRWCVPCQVIRSRAIADNVARLIKERGQCRFVTLTRRHSAAPLSDQIDGLFECFARLRRRAFWTGLVLGGAAFLEVKLSRSQQWHVHLHLIVQGKFLPQNLLSAEWLAVTNDSSIVDVRAVNDAGHAAHYVTKYVTKPADASVYASPPHLEQLVVALRGRRLCTTFGSWRGEQLEELPDDERQWRSVGNLDLLARDAARGDAEARRWIDAATRKWPHLAPLFSRPPPGEGASS